MINWWEGLDLILKILYCISIPASLILIIQTVLAFMGGLEAGPGVDFSDTSGIDFGPDASGADLGDISNGNDVATHDYIGDGGNPADFSIGSMFTLQGVVAFLTVFSWSAIVSISSGTSSSVAIIIAVLLGIVAMYAVARLMYASRRLAENGVIVLKNAVGETGRVYIPIPSAGMGEGKINLNLQGRFVECEAVSADEKAYATGTVVRVIDVRNDLLVVEEDR